MPKKFAWDDLQRWAQKRGELVYAMDQGQTPVLADTDPGKADVPAPGPWGVASDGFCVGLAMRWVGLRFRGQDYPFDRKTHIANGEFWEATRDQNLARTITDPWPARFERVVRGYGASIDSVRSIQKAESISAALVVHTITAGRGLYYFEMRGDGHAHALAVEHGAGVCRLFDGNEGHFLVNLRHFAFFLTYFLNHAPGRYRAKYKAGTWIGVVRR